jgi:hypothetical protein
VTAAALSFRTLVLDSHGFTLAGRRDRDLAGLLVEARRADAEVLVPWTALAECLQGSGRAATQHALSRLQLAPIEEAHYRTAAHLMESTGMGGHTVDALVAAVARDCPRPVIIATSDPADLNQLLQGEPGVHCVRV